MKRIPESTKISFFRWWFVGMIFFLVAFGTSLGQAESPFDLIFFLSVAIAVGHMLIFNPIIVRVFSIKRKNVIINEKILSAKLFQKVLSNLLEVAKCFVIVVLVYLCYQSVNTFFQQLRDLPENHLTVTAEPILFSLLFVVFYNALTGLLSIIYSFTIKEKGMKNYIFIGNIDPYKDTNARYAQLNRLKTECERESAIELSPTHPKASITYMALGIFNNALLYLLTKEVKHLEEAKRWIFTVVGYKDWGNEVMLNVDLSASWVLFGLALAYDWLREDLTEAEKKTIRDKLILQADIMYDYKMAHTGEGWPSNYWQNHNWINMTGLAAAGYALRGEYKNSQKWIDESKDNFKKVFDYLADDGSNYEGVCYWRYGGMWLFVYAHLLKQQENIDYFRTSNYLKNTFYYRLYQSAPDFETNVGFGDCHDKHSSHVPAVYYKTAHEYNDGHAQYYGNLVVEKFLKQEASMSAVVPGILPEAGLEYLWYNPSIVPKRFDSLPLSRYFEDLGLLCLRDGWYSDDKVFSFKCSSPGGQKQWKKGWELYKADKSKNMSLSHHHPDNLSYVLIVGKDYFTCEDGYNRCIKPEHHSTLLVDGKQCDVSEVSDVYMRSIWHRLGADGGYDPLHGTKNESAKFAAAGTADSESDPHKEMYAEIKFFKEDKGVVCIKGETSALYPREFKMKEVSRLVFTDNLKFFVYIDIFDSDSAHIYQTMCNTEVKAAKQPNGQNLYKLKSTDVYYSVVSNAPVESKSFEQTVTAYTTPQEPDKQVRVDMESLSYLSAGAQKRQVFAEAISFGKPMAVTMDSNHVRFSFNNKTYKLFFDGKYKIDFVGAKK